MGEMLMAVRLPSARIALSSGWECHQVRQQNRGANKNIHSKVDRQARHDRAALLAGTPQLIPCVVRRLCSPHASATNSQSRANYACCLELRYR